MNNILHSLVISLNKEETRNFKLFIKRLNVGENRKDEQLFDFMRKSNLGYDENKIQEKLYASEDKNSLYRLKNRLQEEVNKSLLVQHFDGSEEHEVLHLLMLSQIFQKKGNSQLAFHYLHKAEKKANHLDALELLDLVYSELIKLSHDTIEINPEKYIVKRKEIRKRLIQIKEIDDVLAAVIYRLKTSQNFSKHNLEVVDLLKKTIDDFSQSPDIKNSPQLRFKIYHSVSRILLQQHDYPSLEKYLLNAFNQFSRDRLFNRQNHDSKLQMLTYLVNSLFKNNKIDASLLYAEKLKGAMDEFNRELYDKYLFYYYNSLVINYSIKDPAKAIDILNEAKANEIIKKLPFYLVFVYSNLCILYFESKNYKECLKNIAKLTMNEGFKNLDIAFQLKMSVAELIVRFELEDIDYLEYRLKQVNKIFSIELALPIFGNEKSVISILNFWVKNQNLRTQKGQSRLLDCIQKLNIQREKEAEVLDYLSWLKSKVTSDIR
jgi:hypothetical protein